MIEIIDESPKKLTYSCHIFYIGTPSTLQLNDGETTKDYSTRLRTHLMKADKINASLQAIASLQRQGKDIFLQCLCGNLKACHGNVIKELVEQLAEMENV